MFDLGKKKTEEMEDSSMLSIKAVSREAMIDIVAHKDEECKSNEDKKSNKFYTKLFKKDSKSTETTKMTVNNTTEKPVDNATEKPVNVVVKEPIKEPTKEPTKEPDKQPVKETKEPIKEPDKGPLKEPTKESKKDSNEHYSKNKDTVLTYNEFNTKRETKPVIKVPRKVPYIVVITGDTNSGRFTCAYSLALALSFGGGKVLLCEIDDTEKFTAKKYGKFVNGLNAYRELSIYLSSSSNFDIEHYYNNYDYIIVKTSCNNVPLYKDAKKVYCFVSQDIQQLELNKSTMRNKMYTTILSKFALSKINLDVLKQVYLVSANNETLCFLFSDRDFIAGQNNQLEEDFTLRYFSDEYLQTLFYIINEISPFSEKEFKKCISR